MALSPKDESILEEIIDLQGNCLERARCVNCPFRSLCLPEFLYPDPPTQNQRMKLAYDVLAHNSLLDEDTDSETIKEYKWTNK